MDRICQYSTIIFAGNVSVLLIVAILTDYWQYRGFKLGVIKSSFLATTRAPSTDSNIAPTTTTTTAAANLVTPTDTNSYIIIHHFWDRRAEKSRLPNFPGDIWHYQSPALLHRYFLTENVTIPVSAFNGTHNLTLPYTGPQTSPFEDVITLFTQYGNLFRDCDNLEVGVRQRLDLTTLQSHRCFNFILTQRPPGDFIRLDLPAVIYLERGAFAFAVICIVSSVASVVAGGYGLLMHGKQATIAASSAALISGMTLTIAIALFHGKCHLLQRRQFMAGIETPHRKMINDARTVQYGWSFILAWICVTLCFIHTWVWLHQAQDMRTQVKGCEKSLKGSRVHHIRAAVAVRYKDCRKENCLAESSYS